MVERVKNRYLIGELIRLMAMRRLTITCPFPLQNKAKSLPFIRRRQENNISVIEHVNTQKFQCRDHDLSNPKAAVTAFTVNL